MNQEAECLQCPKCECTEFKEYSLDVVLSNGVSLHRNGKADYEDAEINGFNTPSKEVLFYKCSVCGAKYTYGAGKLRKTTRRFEWEHMIP